MRALTKALSVILLLAAPPAAALSEWTLAGGYSSGDTNVGTLTLRYVGGWERFQLRVDVPALTADGPVPVSPGAGLGQGSGRQGKGHQGPGLGPGQGPGQSQLPGEGSEDSSTASDSRSSGLGDVRALFSYSLVGGGVKLYRLDGSLEIKAPTADHSTGLGTGEWDVRLALAGEYRFWSASVFGGLGFSRLGDPPELELRDVLDAYLGVESEPLLGERVVVSGWLEGVQDPLDQASVLPAAGLGVRSLGSTRWWAQAGAGFGPASGTFAAWVGVTLGRGEVPAGPGVKELLR